MKKHRKTPYNYICKKCGKTESHFSKASIKEMKAEHICQYIWVSRERNILTRRP